MDMLWCAILAEVSMSKLSCCDSSAWDHTYGCLCADNAMGAYPQYLPGHQAQHFAPAMQAPYGLQQQQPPHLHQQHMHGMQQLQPGVYMPGQAPNI